jgi:Ca2+-binding EF-hand superfamily protein
MKALTLALAIATVATMSFAPIAYPQTRSAHQVQTMDKDKDGMVSKREFMSMMEAKFDEMDKGKTGKLTATQVQDAIDWIAKTYGTAP